MNPALEIGLVATVLRKSGNYPAAEVVNEKDQASLRVTSDRFHIPRLKSKDKGEREQVFSCSDQSAFLEAIGASALQRKYLEGSTLKLRIAEFPSEEERSCVLYTEWPSDEVGSSVPDLPILGFSATRPDMPAKYGPLFIIGEPPIGFRYVEANSTEHADIAAIAEFFKTVAK